MCVLAARSLQSLNARLIKQLDQLENSNILRAARNMAEEPGQGGPPIVLPPRTLPMLTLPDVSDADDLVIPTPSGANPPVPIPPQHPVRQSCLMARHCTLAFRLRNPKLPKSVSRPTCLLLCKASALRFLSPERVSPINMPLFCHWRFRDANN
eukprot:921564-Prorocentrum_minimum.AAC.2